MGSPSAQPTDGKTLGAETKISLWSHPPATTRGDQERCPKPLLSTGSAPCLLLRKQESQADPRVLAEVKQEVLMASVQEPAGESRISPVHASALEQSEPECCNSSCKLRRHIKGVHRMEALLGLLHNPDKQISL